MTLQRYVCLSPAVMQFGVHNGPTSMQATVREVFRRLGKKFKAFIDDCCVGTGRHSTRELMTLAMKIVDPPWRQWSKLSSIS